VAASHNHLKASQTAKPKEDKYAPGRGERISVARAIAQKMDPVRDQQPPTPTVDGARHSEIRIPSFLKGDRMTGENSSACLCTSVPLWTLPRYVFLSKEDQLLTLNLRGPWVARGATNFVARLPSPVGPTS
jgi:hypothetical protein